MRNCEIDKLSCQIGEISFYLPILDPKLKSIRKQKHHFLFVSYETMIEVLSVFVLILKASVCFELTETFGKQTIEDGPFGGEFYNCCHLC